MATIMFVAAVVATSGWLVLIVMTRHATRQVASSGEAVGRRLNRALLAATLLGSLTTCAAPIVPLIHSFGEVAAMSPPLKAEALDRAIEADRPAMPLVLLSLPILGVGLWQVVANGRRLRRAPCSAPGVLA